MISFAAQLLFVSVCAVLLVVACMERDGVGVLTSISLIFCGVLIPGVTKNL